MTFEIVLRGDSLDPRLRREATFGDSASLAEWFERNKTVSAKPRQRKSKSKQNQKKETANVIQTVSP